LFIKPELFESPYDIFCSCGKTHRRLARICEPLLTDTTIWKRFYYSSPISPHHDKRLIPRLWPTGWTTDVRFPAEARKGFFFVFTVSRPALDCTQPSMQWVPGSFPVGKRPGREAEHSPPSSAEVRKAWSYTSTHPICLPVMMLN
jgi:hypothetical protein